jgi:hypothetical protein
MTAPHGAAGRSSGGGGQWTEKQEFRTVHIQLPPHMLKQAGQGTVQVGQDLQPASNINKSCLFYIYNMERYRSMLCQNSIWALQISVADPDPGSSTFLTLDPGSGIGFFRIPDL